MTCVFCCSVADLHSKVQRSFKVQPTMATSLRLSASRPSTNALAIPSFAQLSPQIYQRRTLSQTSQRWAYKNMNFSPKNLTGPSMKARSREALNGQLPNDIGLLPGTFVRPLWRDLPSVFQNPRDRWQIEWAWMRSSFQNFMRLVTVYPLSALFKYLAS